MSPHKVKKIRKAVLPVTGFGTRVLPATKSLPKEMLPVFDRPAVQWVVDEAIEAGIEHFVFVTGRNKAEIEDYFDRTYELEDTLKIAGKTSALEMLQSILPTAGSKSFVRQQSPLGLGHAVWCARDIIGNEPFAVLLPDVLVQSKVSCLKQMIDAYEKTGGNIIAVDQVPMENVLSYGVIDHGPRNGNIMPITNMVEKPKIENAPSNLKITDDAVARVDGYLGALRTFSAELVQVVRDRDGQIVDHSTGTLSLARPHRFRWDYRDPYVQTIVADGRKLWLYDADLEQVTVRDLEAGLGATPAMLLSGTGRVGDASPRVRGHRA